MIAIEAPKIVTVTLSAMRGYDGPNLYGNTLDWKGESSKNGPAIGAIGAISTISAGLSMGGILGGVLIAGGVLGGIGSLTGNKTLMAIGSVTSLAGGFISADTGAFFNPFAEGAGQSALGKGFSDTFGSVFDKLKTTLGVGGSADLNPAGTLASNTTKSVADVAVDSARSLGGGGLGELVGTGAQTASAAGPAASSGGGLLGGIFNSPGTGSVLAGAASGAASGLLNMGVANAQQDNYAANTALTDAKTASEIQNQKLIDQRQQNLQYQNTGNLATANTEARIYNQAPGTAQGRVPITLPDGSVQLVTLEQYAQMKQNGG